MNISDIILKISFKRIIEFESANQYCVEYEVALNNVKDMLNDKIKVNVHIVKFMLQKMMLNNISEQYFSLVAQLRRDWTHQITNLSKTMKIIVAYFVNTQNVKTLRINIRIIKKKFLLDAYIFFKYVETQRIRHWFDIYWQKFSHLKR